MCKMKISLNLKVLNNAFSETFIIMKIDFLSLSYFSYCNYLIGNLGLRVQF